MELALPADLHKAIEDAYAATMWHPHYALLPLYRDSIYAALGGPHYPGEPVDTQMHRSRVTLDLLTVRQVLPLWESERPNNSWPQHLLEIAEGVLDGSVSMELALDEADAALAVFDDVKVLDEEEEEDSKELSQGDTISDIAMFKGVSKAAFFVCGAALETLYDASGLFRFDYLDLTMEMTDADVDPWSGDSAKWASSAYAGAVWDPSSDPIRRKEFWEWWLKEAIPKAWRETHKQAGSGS